MEGWSCIFEVKLNMICGELSGVGCSGDRGEV